LEQPRLVVYVNSLINPPGGLAWHDPPPGRPRAACESCVQGFTKA